MITRMRNAWGGGRIGGATIINGSRGKEVSGAAHGNRRSRTTRGTRRKGDCAWTRPRADEVGIAYEDDSYRNDVERRKIVNGKKRTGANDDIEAKA